MTQHFDFTFALHHNLAPAADRSFCWSPYSVASAVGMAAAATAGAAHDELVSALRCEPAAALRPLAFRENNGFWLDAQRSGASAGQDSTWRLVRRLAREK